MLGSLFGLGGGCFRGDDSPPAPPASSVGAVTENAGCWAPGLIDGPAAECTKFSGARGTGTELERKCLSVRLPPLPPPSLAFPLLSGALGR